MLGIKAKITDRVFQRIGGDTYKKVLALTWDAIERDGGYKDIKRPLNIIVLIGDDDEVSRLDLSGVY